MNRFLFYLTSFLFIIASCGPLQAQEEEEMEELPDTLIEDRPLYLGVTLGGGVYTVFNAQDVHTGGALLNMDGGFALLSGSPGESFVKLEATYSFFRSPYIAGVSYYEDFINMSMMFSIMKQALPSGKRYLTMSIGPGIRLSRVNGRAFLGESSYSLNKGVFGNYAKVFVASEIALYRDREDGVNALGVRLSADLNEATGNEIPDFSPQQYFSASLFVSLMFGD